jgi:hypothetical protein
MQPMRQKQDYIEMRLHTVSEEVHIDRSSTFRKGTLVELEESCQGESEAVGGARLEVFHGCLYLGVGGVTSRELKLVRWLLASFLLLFLLLVFLVFFLFRFCLFFNHVMRAVATIIPLLLLRTNTTFGVGESLGLLPRLLHDTFHIRLTELMDCSLKRSLPTALIALPLSNSLSHSACNHFTRVWDQGGVGQQEKIVDFANPKLFNLPIEFI